MTGTPSQIELGSEIRLRTGLEFDRVAHALRAAADRQSAPDRVETEAVIAILEEKRAETMAHESAGYFIRDWQEPDGRVRELIAADPRYHQIKSTKQERRSRARKPGTGANGIMNIRPLYDRIVVKRIEEQETTRNGIVIPDSAQEKPQEGEVLATGRGKRLEDGTIVALDVSAGDRILFAKYSGSEIELDGTAYIIMREDDVLGVLDADAKQSRRAA